MRSQERKGKRKHAETTTDHTSTGISCAKCSIFCSKHGSIIFFFYFTPCMVRHRPKSNFHVNQQSKIQGSRIHQTSLEPGSQIREARVHQVLSSKNFGMHLVPRQLGIPINPASREACKIIQEEVTGGSAPGQESAPQELQCRQQVLQWTRKAAFKPSCRDVKIRNVHASQESDTESCPSRIALASPSASALNSRKICCRATAQPFLRRNAIRSSASS